MITMFKTVLTWAVGFLNEKGVASSTRLVMLAVVMVPLIVWTFLSLYHLRMESIPESVLAFVGIGVTLKGADRLIASRVEVAQIEKDKPPAPVTPPPQNIGVQVQTEAG